MQTEFKPEIALDQHQRASLAQTCAEEGYRVIHLIARSEVDKFILDVINVPTGKSDEEKLEKLRVAKTAAMLYEGITNRINHEVSLYVAGKREDREPIDLTEGILDIGPLASTYEALEEELDHEFN